MIVLALFCSARLNIKFTNEIELATSEDMHQVFQKAKLVLERTLSIRACMNVVTLRSIPRKKQTHKFYLTGSKQMRSMFNKSS